MAETILGVWQRFLGGFTLNVLRNITSLRTFVLTCLFVCVLLEWGVRKCCGTARRCIYLDRGCRRPHGRLLILAVAKHLAVTARQKNSCSPVRLTRLRVFAAAVSQVQKPTRNCFRRKADVCKTVLRCQHKPTRSVRDAGLRGPCPFLRCPNNKHACAAHARNTPSRCVVCQTSTRLMSLRQHALSRKQAYGVLEA